MALHDVRFHLAAEVITLLTPVADRRAGLAGFGTTATDLDEHRTAAAPEFGASRAVATDAAITFAARTAARGSALTADRGIRAIRTAAADGDRVRVFQLFTSTAQTLADDTASQVTRAHEYAIDYPVRRALDELDLAQRAADATSLQTVDYLVLATGLAVDGIDVRADYLHAWSRYTSLSEELRDRTSTTGAHVWSAAVGTSAVRTAAALLSPDAVREPGSSGTVEDAVVPAAAVVTTSASRDAELRSAVVSLRSSALAVSRGSVKRSSAQLSDLGWTVAALLVLTAAGVLVVHRYIASPLRRLADQASMVSDGNLVDVSMSGPSDVRIVAQALASTVSSLRRVMAQVQAIAAGDLRSDVVLQPLPGPLGAVIHDSVSEMIEAIHERERLQMSVAHQASHDPLTGLLNRGEALLVLDELLARAHRDGTHVGVLYVDLDHFKQVNDTLGHAAGDEVLQTVSSRMRRAVRDTDTVCRLGGDEFLVLVPGVQGAAELVELGNRLIAAATAPVSLGKRAARVGASVGVAMSLEGSTGQRLLHEADVALYRAKSSGRGRVESFDEGLRAGLAAQSALEEALSRGLEDRQFVLHYQPVVDLSSGRMVSVEALVRWNRPDHGLVPPDEFIPAAEESDLICDIGRWALREGLLQLSRWDAAAGDLAGLAVAVNISGRHVSSRTLARDVEEVLSELRIAPHRLTVEVTETVVVDVPRAVEQLARLRSLGVRVAIDDFGTGYTSIGQLPRLPVDVLKIDRSFITRDDPAQERLVRLMIDAAHSFSLQVVAEGVEHVHQLHRLVADSCDLVQGNVLSRPVSADELACPTPGYFPPPGEPRVAPGEQ